MPAHLLLNYFGAILLMLVMEMTGMIWDYLFQILRIALIECGLLDQIDFWMLILLHVLQVLPLLFIIGFSLQIRFITTLFGEWVLNIKKHQAYLWINYHLILILFLQTQIVIEIDKVVG